MFESVIIGNLGADCNTKTENGKTFTTFRVAHNDRWTDQAGQEHSESIWIDCIMNDRPKVCDYLKAGQLVYVTGNTRLRVYSSAKDKCMKAGVTISVRRIELLGGNTDAIPSRLVDANGVLHDVTKYYWTDVPDTQLMAVRGGSQFIVDANGWITKVVEQQQEQGDAQTDVQAETSQDNE